MKDEFNVQPLSYSHRRRTFALLFTLFIVSLPFLYLYATGYRFDLRSVGNIVSTGGIYVAAERAGAEIYIDGELVRETRVFRRAFYAQSLDPGTHRIHVQKEGHHTWVKELPVSPHLVTEAQAFNMPVVPEVRIITKWQTGTGSAVVRTPLIVASTTNEFVATTTSATSTFIQNAEYDALFALFASSAPTSTPSTVRAVAHRIESILENSTTTIASTTDEIATTTKEVGNVRLYASGEDVYAEWIGAFEQMPYYYCAEEFPPYGTSTPTTTDLMLPRNTALVVDTEEGTVIDPSEEGFMHPVQTVSPDTHCEPSIRIDRKKQTVHYFDFFPGSTDLVVLGLDDGIYVIEIDDRSWQNVQPLVMGNTLAFRIINGSVYLYDGAVLYQVSLDEQ